MPSVFAGLGTVLGGCSFWGEAAFFSTLGRVFPPYLALYAMWADLLVWKNFLGSYNWVNFWRQELNLEAKLQVSFDAAGSFGFEVYIRGHWCLSSWPET